MRTTTVRRLAGGAAAALVLVALPLPGLAQSSEATTVLLGDPSDAAPLPPPIGFATERPQPAVPADRYDLASGCWEVRTRDGRPLRRAGSLYVVGGDAGTGDPLHLRASDLGTYLLFAPDETFVARTTATPVPAGPAGVGVADGPGTDADWVVDEVDGAGANAFTIQLPATDEVLVATDAGDLALDAVSTDVVATSSGEGAAAQGPPAADVAALPGAVFSFHRTAGCATWPDPQVNVTGTHPTGRTTYGEVRGHLDGHVHMMAFEFIGGEIRCGRPWHRWGAPAALVDCPDHETGGPAEAVLNSPDDAFGHDTTGWPTFVDWPAPRSLTHEQMYVTWLERTWRGGLRVMVNLLVDNETLCEIYPLKRNECDETATMRLEAERLRELERYVDAQWGGPGRGWFRIVTDPAQARRTVNEGRLAVVMGIETSEPFGCTLRAGRAECTEADVRAHVEEFFARGVRQMELVNKYDNAFAGVTGDGGSTGPVTNAGNFWTTGSWLDMQTCPEEFGEHRHDKQQPTASDVDEGFRPAQDAIFGDVGSLLPTPVQPAPTYPSPPHCNTVGLLDLGRTMLDLMIERGMLFDPDHMSTRARQQALAHMEERGYRGLISSHSWADPTVYEHILGRGGIVTPYAGDSTSFVAKWRAHREWADPRFWFGFGYGADTNGFGGQGTARGADAQDPVTYPFTGFGGVTVDRQVSGERVYDVNVDGVAHYGLYVDWLEDLRRLAGDEIIADMERGAEAYLQVWERATGVHPDRCLVDPNGPGADVLRLGMSASEVVRAFGQPSRRDGTSFVYCVPGGDGTARDVVVRFDATGALVSVERSGARAAPDPGAGGDHHGGVDGGGGTGLPATGAGAASLATGLLALGLLLRHGHGRRAADATRSGAAHQRRGSAGAGSERGSTR